MKNSLPLPLIFAAIFAVHTCCTAGTPDSAPKSPSASGGTGSSAPSDRVVAKLNHGLRLFDAAVASGTISAFEEYQKKLTAFTDSAKGTPREAITQDEVARFLMLWLGLWNSGDTAQQASLYAPDFAWLSYAASKGFVLQSKDQIFADRENYVKGGASILVDVSELEILQEGGLTSISFIQNYQRGMYRTKGSKSLRLRRGGPAGLLIVFEEFNLPK